MTNKRPDTEEEPILECDVCMKEIPRSVGESLEGPDYVHHFCGAECYEQWKKKNSRPPKP